MNKIQLTGAMIATANEAALRAMRRAGVPLAKAQKLILSEDWRKEMRLIVAAKVKRLEAK